MERHTECLNNKHKADNHKGVHSSPCSIYKTISINLIEENLFNYWRIKIEIISSKFISKEIPNILELIS